jgi:hypothetical protein
MEQTPSTQATTETTSTQYPMQAIVDYLPGVTIVGAKPSLLEWGFDNHIRLFEMDFDTNQAKSVIFDTPVAQITKVTGSMIMLTFHIGDKKYNVQFSDTAMAKMGVTVVGLYFAHAETKASGINDWAKRLKENAVDVSVMGWSWAIKWGFIGAGVILVGAIIYVLATRS